MQLYSALIKKNKQQEIEEVILLDEAFSFSAFFFGPLWFLYHKMWSEFFIFILTTSILENLIGKICPDFVKSLLEIILLILVAINAKYWLCQSLKKKKYDFIGAVFGKDHANANLRFIKNFKSDLELGSLKFYD